MANLTVTVKSSGGDYTSLNAALAGEAKNLVTNTQILTIECYAFSDTVGATTGTGYTTSATYYINIVVPTAERHAGVWDSSKYNLVNSYAANAMLYLNEQYVDLTGLQIKNTYAASGAECAVNTQSGADGGVINYRSCIFPGSRYSFRNGANNTVNIYNTLGYGGTVAGFVSTIATATINAYNSLFKGGTYGIHFYNGTWVLKNCYAYGVTGNDYSSTTGVTLTTCASADLTGNIGLRSIPYDTTTFTNVTSGSEDFHLVAGSALIGVGTDLSAQFTDDITGATR